MSHRAFDGYITTQTANGIDGYATIFRAQNATGTGSRGGDLVLASGSGLANDGYVRMRTGSRTVLSLDGYQIMLDGYLSTPMIRQYDMPTPGVDGYSLLIKGQTSLTGPTARGGNILLRGGDGYAGDGTARDGYIQMYSGPTEVLRIADKRRINLAGERLQLTTVNTSPYAVLSTDSNLMVDTTSARTINLPASPIAGDAYRVKDSTGTAATNNITVSGNGKNIEGTASATINTNFASLFLVYNGTQWVKF